jgi:putative ABC transport system permease protein
MVFSPNTFAGAPATSLATLTLPDGARAHEAGLLADVARTFPMVTAIGVREALEQVNSLVSKLALAIRGASAVTIVASVLVLAGALGAGQRARIGDAVILKTLGATRLKLFAAFLLEYGLLGAVTALFGFLAGSLAAWAIVTRLMNLGFHWLIGSALSACIVAIVVTILFGLVGTWRILSQKPAPYLRNL